jgi:hypothetical protein
MEPMARITRTSELRCPSNCPEGLFEALNATLIVNRDGTYAGHEAHGSTFLCVTCRGVAIDLAAAAQEMVNDHAADPVTLTCPACHAVMLPPEDDPLASRVECPSCEQRFFIEEGMPYLHGGGGGGGEG